MGKQSAVNELMKVAVLLEVMTRDSNYMSYQDFKLPPTSSRPKGKGRNKGKYKKHWEHR
jgi:hypothetical protein